jgi:AcrR family transcriptional regulator
MQSGGADGRPQKDRSDGARPLSDGPGRPDTPDAGDEPEGAEGPTDGRTARRIRNEAAVIDAMIELISEGEFDPTAEQIADRAGVSHRSVYRYFSSRTQLIEAVIERVLDRIAPVVFFEGVGEGSFDERAARFVEARVAAFGDFGPIARAAFRRAVSDEAIEQAIDAARSMLREQLVQHFDSELTAIEPDRRRLVVALLDTLLQFEALEHMTGPGGLSDDELGAALSMHLEMHLRPPVAG